MCADVSAEYDVSEQTKEKQTFLINLPPFPTFTHSLYEERHPMSSQSSQSSPQKQVECMSRKICRVHIEDLIAFKDAFRGRADDSLIFARLFLLSLVKITTNRQTWTTY